MIKKLYATLLVASVAAVLAILFFVACISGLGLENSRLRHGHQHQHNIPHSHRGLE